MNEFEKKMHSKAVTAQNLLYIQFRCPHCGRINVCLKVCLSQSLLCSYRGCRRIIILSNFNELHHK